MKIVLSIIAGVLIATANFFAIVYIVKGLVKGGGGWKFGLFAGLKFILLISIFFVIVKWAPVNIIALLGGFTVALLILIIFSHERF